MSMRMPPASPGQLTRATILHIAARLATVEGLEGLSIGQLASATGLSKSGLYAHFGSKEELQLATIQAPRPTLLGQEGGPAPPPPGGPPPHLRRRRHTSRSGRATGHPPPARHVRR